MVNIKYFANSQMNKIISHSLFLHGKSKKNLDVDYKIQHLLATTKLCCQNTTQWLSPQLDNLKYQEIIDQYQTLTAYEWNSFELYFDKKIIKHQYNKNINAVIESFGYWKKKYFPTIPICLIVIVQKGVAHNITIKMHVERKAEFYLDENIENYKQPVLYAFYNAEGSAK